jgi:hypothetical protein
MKGFLSMTCNQKCHISLTGLIFFALTFASCSVLSNKTTTSPEEALRSRVSVYWDARVKDTPEKAYELLDPDSRKATSFASYSRRISHSTIVSYKIHDVTVDLKNKKGTVQVERSFRILPGVIPINIDQELSQTTDDEWILVDGQWYMTYYPPAGLNFMNLPGKQPENRAK